jgi:hypothetical protein
MKNLSKVSFKKMPVKAPWNSDKIGFLEVEWKIAKYLDKYG